jgi:ketosteroid isomerase-like protein
MKPFKFILCLITIVVLVKSACAQTTDSIAFLKFKQEFQAETEKWKVAYNSKDARNLEPLYTENADYVSSHVNGLEANGRDKIIAYFQAGINFGGHIDSIEILKINVSCDIATLLCKYQATNSGITVVGRNVLVMKKVGDKWLIALHITVV